MKIFFRRSSQLVLSLILMMMTIPGYAQETPIIDKKSETPEQKHEYNRWEKALIQGNINISEWFDGAAEGLDMFLVGRRVTNRENETNVRIENTTTSAEGRALANFWGFSINPRFPNFEEYWHLKFATYDERQDRRNARNTYLRQQPRERNYGATVGLFKKLGNIRTAFQPRIELQDPLKVSHSLTFESVADQKSFEINPKIEFYANPVKGVGTFQGLNFNFILSPIWSMTLVNQGDYEERKHIYYVTNGVSFGQILDARSALSYSYFMNSSNRPNYHLDAFNFSVAYSRTIYRRILDFQFIPNMDFQREVSFRGNIGCTLNFNMNF